MGDRVLWVGYYALRNHKRHAHDFLHVKKGGSFSRPFPHFSLPSTTRQICVIDPYHFFDSQNLLKQVY